LEPVDSRGAGDAMTAALCVSIRRGDDVSQMLRFACAAGAATVARHGLGNADREVIDSLLGLVQVTSIGRNQDAATTLGQPGEPTAPGEPG
ncbi:MAG: PfkB family carbohydrate kinase, partial [Ilumatobacter sp.]